MVEANEETPWAMVQRMKTAGAAFDAIVVALQERGLSREDLELLLQDEPGFRAWSRGQQPVTPVAPAPSPVTTTPTDTGRTLRWTGITLSALVGGVVAASARSGLGLMLSVAALLPAMGLLAGEFRKGVRRTARPLGFVLFFAFILPSLAGLIAGWGLAQAASLALFLSSVPMLVWASHSGERLKGLPDFVQSNIFESHDVQFTVSWPVAKVGPGDTVDVVVHAQNCVDVPRTLTVKVRGDLRSSLAAFEHNTVLEPGCIIEATVPVRVPPLAPERFTFTIDVAGSGTEVGRRVRLAKGAEWITPSESLTGNLLGVATLAAVGVGVFTIGSNGAITVSVDTEKAMATSAAKFSVRELYRPEQAALLAAATS